MILRREIPVSDWSICGEFLLWWMTHSSLSQKLSWLSHTYKCNLRVYFLYLNCAMTCHRRSYSPPFPLVMTCSLDDKLAGEFKPLKNISGLENGTTELPKLRSALKLSTVNAPKIQTETSLDTNNNRRGSVGLGRSKSVCHKVKFEPPKQQILASTNEGKPCIE